jgi:hypothetical protein
VVTHDTARTQTTVYVPIGIALSHSKIDLVSLDKSKTTFDYSDTGIKVKTSWVGPKDAFLVYDHNSNGEVDSSKELVLTRWSEDATTDFTALKEVFDSNGDNKLDAKDAKFNSFLLWQDKNQDGVSQSHELKSLPEAGLVQINFDSEQTISGEFFGKQQAMQVAGISWADGRETLAYDLGLEAVASYT